MNYKVLFFLLFSCCSLSAQVDSSFKKSSKNLGKHELKFNPVLTLLSLPEISYELILNNQSTTGLSVAYTIDQEHLDIDFLISPYYRRYLGKGRANGFYFEGNLTYYKTTSLDYNFPIISKVSPRSGIAIGGALGYKIISSNGIVVDFTAGLGKTFENEDKFTPRFGISLGKRLGHTSLEYATSTEKTSSSNNEIRINLLHLAVGFPEITYERYVNDFSSIGISFSYSFNDKFIEQYFITPHYRLYFGDNLVNSFFTEIGLIYWKEDFQNEFLLKKSVGFGGEFAIGYKFRKIPSYPIEILLGFGRSFTNEFHNLTNISTLENTFIPRVGVSIGRQF